MVRRSTAVVTVQYEYGGVVVPDVGQLVNVVIQTVDKSKEEHHLKNVISPSTYDTTIYIIQGHHGHMTQQSSLSHNTMTT